MNVSPSNTPAVSPLHRMAREAFGLNTSQAGNAGARGSDSVSLSGAASTQKYVDQLADLEPRAGLVADVQAQIQAGTYVTDEKLNAALESLLGDL